MNKFIWALLCLLFTAATTASAQNNNTSTFPSTTSTNTGTVAQWMHRLQLNTSNTLTLQLPDGSTLSGDIRYRNTSNGELHLQGGVTGRPGASFSIDLSNDNLQGRILMPHSYKAYVYTTDATGTVRLAEADLRKLQCVDFAEGDEHSGNTGQKPTDVPDVSSLQSNPGAGGCLLMDFDGYEMPAGNYWNMGQAISAAASGMSNADMLVAWQIVSEDFYPFNLNVTTSEAVFATYPQNKRSRCVVTPTNYFFPNCAGIAFTGSFTFQNEAPCWIFTSGTGLTGKRVGEASSHELGHTLGLSHDGAAGTDYYFGHGNWASIMGNSLSKPVTQWSKGEYTGATNTEDDLAIIAGATNGVGYRADDYGSTFATATALVQTGGVLTAGQNKGFIGGSTDMDVFSFSTPGGNTALSVQSGSGFANVRISVKLYNATGTLLNSYLAQVNDLSAPIAVAQNLPAGLYYLVITGAAAGNASGDYDDYASLGKYEIMGSTMMTPLATSLAAFTASVVDNHITALQWNTYNEQQNAGFAIERSANGKDFSRIALVQPLTDGNSDSKLDYSYRDEQSLPGTSYYRLQQLSRDGSSVYSAIASVTRADANSTTLTAYPNPAGDRITVAVNGANGTPLYITDVTGRRVMHISLNSETTTIDLSTLRSGMYLLQYGTAGHALSTKIIKQ